MQNGGFWVLDKGFTNDMINKTMAKPKKTKQQQRQVLIDIAKKLYAQGLTTREIGKQINKSHTWVAWAVNGTLT